MLYKTNIKYNINVTNTYKEKNTFPGDLYRQKMYMRNKYFILPLYIFIIFLLKSDYWEK